MSKFSKILLLLILTACSVSSYGQEQSESKQRSRYYAPAGPLSCGRFCVSGQLGAFGFIDIGESDFLKNEKERICAIAEIAAGKLFRDRRRVGFSAGLGLRTMRYYFENNFNLKTSGNEVYADYSLLETDDFKKHFLRISQVTLPLGMSFRFSLSDKDVSNLPLEVNLYATGTMRCQSREKQIYKIDGVKKKVVFEDDFLLRRFGCDFSLELLFLQSMGFRYTISPLTMFDSGVSPKVYCHSCTFSFKIGIR